MIAYEDEATGLRRKVCTRCKRDLNTNWFPRDKRRADGLMVRCRECQQTEKSSKNATGFRFGTPDPDNDRDPRIAKGILPAKLKVPRTRVADRRLEAITEALREGKADNQVELAIQLKMTYSNLRDWLRRFLREGKIKHDEIPRGNAKKRGEGHSKGGYYKRIRNIRIRQIIRFHTLHCRPTITAVAQSMKVSRTNASNYLDLCLSLGVIRLEETNRQGGRYFSGSTTAIGKRVCKSPAAHQFLFDTKAGQIIDLKTNKRTPAPHADEIHQTYRTAKHAIGWAQRYIPLWRIKRIETKEPAGYVQK